MTSILKPLKTLWIKASLKLNPTTRTLDEAVAHSLETAVRATYVMLKKGICPSEETARTLASLGLYEPLLSLAASGCSIQSSILMDAFRFFTLAGDTAKAAKAAEIVGIKLPEPNTIVLYCSRHRRVLDWDGFIIDSKSLNPGSVARLLSNTGWDKEVLTLAWKASVIRWGCTGRGVDARLLSRILLPDVPESMSAIAYGLEEDPREPTRVLRRLAAFFMEVGDKIWILEGPPQEFSELEAFRGVPRSQRGRCVIVTDRPKAVMPVLKPYIIDLEEAVGGNGGLELLALRMLEARGGDPARAFYYSQARGWDKLSSLIARSIRHNKDPGPLAPCVQVEPQDLAWALDHYPGLFEEREVIIDCIRPTIQCLREAEPSRFERALISRGVSLPQRRAYAGPLKAIAKYTVPDTLSHITGVTTGGGVPLKVAYGSESLKDPRDSIRVAAAMLDGDGLIVAPGGVIVEAAPEGVEVLEDVDEWIDKGGISIVSWSRILERPDILYSSGKTIIVYPEAAARTRQAAQVLEKSRIEGLQVLEDTVVETVSKAGGVSVSRTLAFNDSAQKVNTSIQGEAAPGRVRPERVMDEFRAEFKRLWGEGFELRRHQAATLAVLASYYGERRPGVVMSVYPTGSGKSAIYQVAARVAATNGYGGYALVVSPLKALMRDQVVNAVRRGLIAMRIDSTMSKVAKRLAIDAARKGLVDLLYITPERFQDPDLEALLEDTPPALIILDEAHTLSSWGNTFRPSYLYMAKRIMEYVKAKGWPPLALFTATATRGMVREILSSLGIQDYKEEDVDPEKLLGSLPDAVVLRTDPIREELHFDIVPASHGEDRIQRLVKVVEELTAWANRHGKPWIGLVFTGYVKSEKNPWANVDKVATELGKRLDVKVLRYHGQLGEAERRRIEDEVRGIVERGGSGVLVATKAFGMGVDIPVIRWVVHFYPSDSPEDLYQEAGRAGRDGREARIIIMYSPADFEDKKRMIQAQRIRPSTVISVYNMLARLARESGLGKGDTMAIPLATVAYEGDAIKVLDALRGMGLLDYWVTHAELAAYTVEDEEAFEDYTLWYWKLGRIYLTHSGLPRTRLWRRETLTISTCIGDRGREVKIKAGNLEISSGPCKTATWKYTGGATQIALITFPIRKPREIDLPGPEDFQRLVLRSNQELDSIDELQRMMEAALAARASGGPPAADKTIKDYLRRYFDSDMDKRKLQTSMSGKVVECPTITRCLDKITSQVRSLVDAIGRHGITLAVKDQDVAYVLKQALLQEGIDVDPSITSYRRILAVSSLSRQKLLDYGYIVVVARESSQTLKALERLRGYPYTTIYTLKA